MSTASTDRPSPPHAAGPLPPEPMDPGMTSIQPGGGVVLRLELAWGQWRRLWLATVRPEYVRRMAVLRRGEFNGCPHPALDPRDVKFFRNQGGYHWDPADDPFRWRDRLPFARAGLSELVVGSGLTAPPAVALAAWLTSSEPGLSTPARLAGWTAVAVLSAAGFAVAWFFRDPPRRVPAGPGLVVSPADGTVVAVDDLDHDESVGGPAVRVGVFLSVFDVHLTRAPVAARVVGLTYLPGKHLNALRAASARENEQLTIRLQESAPPYRRYVVRQIAGAIARRIVCWVKPGDELTRGERLGMIKLGSRTEVVLPREAGMEVRVRPGDKVRAGVTVVAAYAGADAGSESH